MSTEIFPEKLVKIETVVANEGVITLKDLRTGSRAAEFSLGRWMVWAIAKRDLGYSPSYLGRLYKKDHSTVHHGIARMKIGKNAKLLEKTRDLVKAQYPGLLG